MKSHPHIRPHRDRVPADSLSAEQSLKALERAFFWRDKWRTEVAARRNRQVHPAAAAFSRPAATPARPAKPAGSEPGRFAAAMAREELGRFYWSARQARLLAEALR